MAEIVVDSDMNFSSISTTIDDVVKVVSGATLTFDEGGSIEKLQIGDSTSNGYIVFSDSHDADFSDPTIKFKAKRDETTGIRIYGGSLEVVNPFDHRVILISELGARAARYWSVKSEGDISNDFELIGYDGLEVFGVHPAIIYYDGSSPVNLILPHGLLNLSRGLENKIEDRETAGSTPWQEFKSAGGEELEIETKIVREGDLDRYELKRLRYYARNKQNNRDALLVSDEKITFGKVGDPSYGSDTPKDFDLSFKFWEER